MNINKQNFSFLGGLVSQKLDERIDMDKFGKWFKVADNIRFDSIGAMRNRTGFVKIANTKNNIQNDNIRLLSFVFNNRESFLLELGQGYMRVFKNGIPIKDDNGLPKEWTTGITFPEDTDLKYTQSGDIIFLTIPSSGIFEIRRKNIEGTEWEIKNFEADIYPSDDENDDKDQKITVHPTTGTSFYQGVYENFLKDYGFPLFYSPFCNETKPGVGVIEHSLSRGPWISAGNFVSYLNSLTWADSRIYIRDGDNLVVRVPLAEDFDETQKYEFGLHSIGPESFTKDVQNRIDTANGLACKYVVGGLLHGWSRLPHGYVLEITPEMWAAKNEVPTFQGALDLFNQLVKEYYLAHGYDENYSRPYFRIKDGHQGQQNVFIETRTISGKVVGTKVKEDNSDIVFRSTTLSVAEKQLQLNKNSDGNPYYIAKTTKDFFNNVPIGSTVSVTHKVNADSLSVSQGTGVKDETLLGVGAKWRVVTSGNWAGEITLSYFSYKNNTWVKFRQITSISTDQPTNDNASGEITGDDLLDYKVHFNLTGGTVNLSFNTNSADVVSAFKVADKTDNKTATVVCLKNPPTNIAETIHFAPAAFSSVVGWPETVGFYQNRLFFGKEFKLYGSKTNDFWDFYTPVSVNDDDPITMSLLSYKVNEIVNIVTLKNFFVFTAGGEFGIGSSGALTQKDKFLKQYSAHGSSKCLPIVSGSMILFVDSSSNTVRAFKYSFESDTYEADDVTVMLDEHIRNEEIVSTAYSANEKECYFVTRSGKIFVFKFFPEQNIMAWSIWKHAKYDIKNICIVPRGYKEDLYIAVNTENGMEIERLSEEDYADGVVLFNNDSDVEQITTSFVYGANVVVNDGVNKYNAIVGENGVINLARPAKNVAVGLAYKSQAVLLAPVIMLQDGVATSYNTRKTFKAYFKYSNSYGFKVGVYGHEHMEPHFQGVNTTIDDETVLTTGKKSVLIPSRYDDQGNISFLQERPYPMVIENVLLAIDYGNK